MPLPVVDELEHKPRRRLPEPTLRWLAGGAGDEITLADTEAAWRRLRLRPRVAIDVAEVSTATEVLGHTLATPVLLAPTGRERVLHADGELASARAASRAGRRLHRRGAGRRRAFARRPARVLVDGGVRTGADVLRALAVGASAVLIGRPYLWGLAARGAEGVAMVLDAFADDIRQVMRLTGVPSLSAVGGDLVVDAAALLQVRTPVRRLPC